MSQPASLWKHRDFVQLWAAQGLSAIGSRVTRTALPIIAIAVLGVGDGWVAVLAAIGVAAGVLVSLFAGGWIDRVDKRSVMISCDWLRALLVASLPLSYVLGVLSLFQLVVVGGAVGAASALFVIADKAYLPQLISRDQLSEGNAKLEATEAVAEIGGPALAGGLIRGLGAPLALLVDSVSYVWSALFLRRIGAVTPVIANVERARIGSDLRLGLRALFRHPLLRPLILTHAVWSASGGFFMSLYIPYCLNVLRIGEGTLGVVIATGGVGALLGAWAVPWVNRRFSWGPQLIVVSIVSLAGALLIPLASGSYATKVAFLIGHQVISDGLAVIFLVQAVSARQLILPLGVLGRANAAAHLATTALVPVAALAAGFISEMTDTRTAVWTGVLLGLAAPLFLLPIAHVRSPAPTPTEEPT